MILRAFLVIAAEDLVVRIFDRARFWPCFRIPRSRVLTRGELEYSFVRFGEELPQCISQKAWPYTLASFWGCFIKLEWKPLRSIELET